MIWQIASVPFWICSGVFFTMGACALVHGIVKASDMDQAEFNRGMIGAVVSLIGAGILALLAAKICS